MVPVKGVEGVYKVAFESLWENCFSEMGYREFKRDLYNGNLFEGVRAAAVGKHDVLLTESAADICSKLASLLKSLKDLLTVSLYGNKGKFEEDDLRSIFAAYDMDVPSAKRFITSLLESRVEEGRSVSYITSAKKKDEDKLMFTVTRGFDLLLSRYQKLCAQRITGKKGDRLLFYVTPFSDLNMLLNLLSMLNVVDFTVEGLSLLSPCPRRQLQLVYHHLESHDSPRNPPRGQKGAEGVTPHGREVIFAVSEGTSRTPAQDYKNPGTRFRGSCTKFHRTPQQCAPCSFLTTFLIITTL